MGVLKIEEFETDSAAAGHIEGLTLRLFNPETRQWRLYWATVSTHHGSTSIGEFKNGRGEFYAQDILNGKAIFIRFIWTDTTTNTPHFEQSFTAARRQTLGGELDYQSDASDRWC